MEPLVSVVIPTFRRHEGVVAAVRSALAEEDIPLEVIVLDDSPENSAAPYIDAIDDLRVQYVPCTAPTNGRPAVVRNRGLRLARGTYVHFLDDDDALEPGALALLVDALEHAPAIGVAIGLVRPVGDDPVALEHERAYFADAARRLRATHGRFTFVARLLFSLAPVVCSACIIRRELALAIGGFAEDIRRVQDGEFYMRAVRERGFVLVDQPVIRYTTSATSLIHAPNVGPLLLDSYRTMYRHYRERRGTTEFVALRLLMLWRSFRERRDVIPLPAARS